MSDVAFVGHVDGPEKDVPKQTQTFGSTPTLMRTYLVLPCPRYIPYGTRVPDVKIGVSSVVSRVMQGHVQARAKSLREQLDDIRIQLSAATVPLSVQAQGAS